MTTIQISKPDWLRNFLSGINFQIFTWTLNIGDWIEWAVDWVITPVNIAFEWIDNLGQWIEWLKNEIVQKASWLKSEIDKAIQPIKNQIDTWLNDLNSWWETKKPIVTGWIDTALSIPNVIISQLRIDLDKASSSLNSFFTSTLPQLASKLDVSSLIASSINWMIAPISLIQNFGKDIVEFFGDPPSWFIKHFNEIIEKMW